MKVGDLVEIIAPENAVGWPAGKTGLVTAVLSNGVTDYIVSVTNNQGIKNVYVYHREIRIINESR